MKRLRGDCGTDPRTINGRSIPAILLDAARSHPQQVFMRTKHHGIWQELRWRDALVRIRELAAGMSLHNIVKGDIVAMVSENIAEAYLVEYATQCLGGIFLGIYPDITAPELQYLISHSGASLIFAEDQEQVDKLISIKDRLPTLKQIVYIDGRGLWDYQEKYLLSITDFINNGQTHVGYDFIVFEQTVRAVHLDDIAVISYTSGTTGNPKGALLSHRQILDSAYRIMSAFNLLPHTEYLSYISLGWAAEQITGVGLGVLAPMIINFAEKPETLQSDLRELGPQFLLFAPRQWEMIASSIQSKMLEVDPIRQSLYHWAIQVGLELSQKKDGANRKIKHFIAEHLILRALRDNVGLVRTRTGVSAGSGLSAEMFSFFRGIGVQLHNVYGATEAGLLTAHWRGRFKPETMGQILPTCPSLKSPIELEISDDGELIALGGSMFSGYLHDPEATNKTLDSSGRLFTGDAVRLDTEGDLIFLDRKKDMRRLAGGQLFPPQFIENHLRASPFIRDAIIIGDETKEYVTALINIDGEIFRRWCEHRGIAAATFTEMSQLDAVRHVIADEILKVNRLLDSSARVKKFANLPKDLDPDDAELTRSRKLKRDVIYERYSRIISSLYEDVSYCTAEIRVTYQDGTKSMLSALVHINIVEDISS
ncbi:MAG TPA: AMP-binding protein [Bellilinea sp.]|nr:AMP-binding protein [Bellilinea sp.]